MERRVGGSDKLSYCSIVLVFILVIYARKLCVGINLVSFVKEKEKETKDKDKEQRERSGERERHPRPSK